MAAGSPFNVTCDRCGTKSPPSVKGPGDAMAQGWSRFEQLGEDGDTVHFVTLCPECLTEGEEAGLWPTPSSSSRGGRGDLMVASEELPLVSWGNAGSTYYAVMEGRIVGLLYFEGEGLGEEDGPGGESVVTPPEWFLVLADAPKEHLALGAPPLEEGMSDNELMAATDAALEEATAMIEDHLSGGAG